MPSCSRRRALGLLASIAIPGLGRKAYAQAYPDKRILMVVPFPPGGGFDTIARPFGERFGQLLGEPVVIDNRAGSGGNIGTDFVARAPADGYTLLFANDYLATNPSINPNVRYDPLKDFAPVGMVGTTQIVIAVRPEFEARDFAQLVAMSKKRPLTFGSPGVGTSPHLVGEYLSSISPLKILHVPYKGTAPAVTDTMGGQIDMVLATEPSVAADIAAGKLRGLAVLGGRRSTLLPEVPTLPEIGGPAINYEVWYCLMAPAATPAPVLAQLRRTTVTALDAGLTQRLAKLGYNVKPEGPEQLTALLERDLARWREVARHAKISID